MTDSTKNAFTMGAKDNAGLPMSDLEPIEPAEAVALYLNDREPELSDKTLMNQRYRLRSFVVFCDEHDVTNLNNLGGRELHRFRVWRRRGSDEYDPVNTVTLRGILQTLRVFLEFCASIDAVDPGLRERVQLPEVDAEEEARDELLSEQQAEEILAHLERFKYASREHVLVAILWHTGIRLGSLRALDVKDFDQKDRCLKLRHRPATGTPLKNKDAAERSIAVGEHYCQVIADYIEHNREPIRDTHGRRPLITSKQGRLSSGAIRNAVYSVTRPCQYGECPHDRNPETCEAMTYSTAHECPSSRSPHGIRRGSITKHLRDGTPQDVVSDRANVSAEVLERHYDQRSEQEKMELRRRFLEDA